MKFGAICCLYDDVEYLDVFLDPIMPCVDELVFLMSDTDWAGKKRDNSAAISKVDSLCKRFGGRISVIHKHWDNEVDQRNFGLSYFRDKSFNFVFITDSDEIYSRKHFKKIVSYIAHYRDVPAFHIEWNTYWTKEYYRISPRESFKPVIAVDPSRFIFTREREGSVNVNGDHTYRYLLIPSELAICYHLSYARSDEYIKNKIQIYDKILNTIPGWYENVWSKWKPEMQDLHPVTAGEYKIAVKEEFSKFPEALKYLIKKEVMPKRKCSIIILNWNSLDLLKRCLGLVEALTYKCKYEIVIVDNGSIDGSVEYIKTLKQYIRIYNNKNLGFAGGVNSALKNIDYGDVCLLNVDAEVQPGWLDNLYESMTTIPSAGIVGPLGNEVASGWLFLVGWKILIIVRGLSWLGISL